MFRSWRDGSLPRVCGREGGERSPPAAEARRSCGPRAGSAAVVSTVASEASRRAELHSGLCARPVSLLLWGGGGVFRDTERSALCAGATGRPAAPSRPPGPARPLPRPLRAVLPRGSCRLLAPCSLPARPAPPHLLPEPALVTCVPRALPPDRTVAAAASGLQRSVLASPVADTQK